MVAHNHHHRHQHQQRAYQHLNSPHRQYLHKRPHTYFLPALSLSLCLACDRYFTTHVCASCALKLCSRCAELITSRLMRGSLARLVAAVARHKLGYAEEFLERESYEAEMHGAGQVAMVQRTASVLKSGLKMEVFQWMLWEESTGSSLSAEADDGETELDGEEFEKEYECEREREREREDDGVQREREDTPAPEPAAHVTAVVRTHPLSYRTQDYELRRYCGSGLGARKLKRMEEESESKDYDEDVKFDVSYKSLRKESD
ncbi:hypothetical protein BZA05DRAFT_451975 [Tricharina praecox]|uniref:uncharacterized protein n=1 Tax=Tricharina praecox TaxID=43433 RepID=UPI00221EFCE1|nr:uncharacterized protein BZA05DRAFT_451975 [Tricharina praecox]KAI5852091.1 hypothetical protein BZA05DRAFT_451975 [Tricharina praecox]